MTVCLSVSVSVMTVCLFVSGCMLTVCAVMCRPVVPGVLDGALLWG